MRREMRREGGREGEAENRVMERKERWKCRGREIERLRTGL